MRAVEQAAVVNSVTNLMTFPWIAERVAAGKLVLHAWWFNLTKGQLYAFNPAIGDVRAGAGRHARRGGGQGNAAVGDQAGTLHRRRRKEADF